MYFPSDLIDTIVNDHSRNDYTEYCVNVQGWIRDIEKNTIYFQQVEKLSFSFTVSSLTLGIRHLISYKWVHRCGINNSHPRHSPTTAHKETPSLPLKCVNGCDGEESNQGPLDYEIDSLTTWLPQQSQPIVCWKHSYFFLVYREKFFYDILGIVYQRQSKLLG